MQMVSTAERGKVCAVGQHQPRKASAVQSANQRDFWRAFARAGFASRLEGPVKRGGSLLVFNPGFSTAAVSPV